MGKSFKNRAVASGSIAARSVKYIFRSRLIFEKCGEFFSPAMLQRPAGKLCVAASHEGKCLSKKNRTPHPKGKCLYGNE